MALPIVRSDRRYIMHGRSRSVNRELAGIAAVCNVCKFTFANYNAFRTLERSIALSVSRLRTPLSPSPLRLSFSLGNTEFAAIRKKRHSDGEARRGDGRRAGGRTVGSLYEQCSIYMLGVDRSASNFLVVCSPSSQ